MTHGCLLIIDDDREIWLHTYHTGMDIPLVVRNAIATLANNWKDVAAIGLEDGKTPEEAVESFLSHGTYTERLTYGKSAAALIIAAQPCFLEPLFPAYRKDLPTWSGLEHPYTLRIIDEERWVLTDEDGKELFDVNVFDELKSELVKLLKV